MKLITNEQNETMLEGLGHILHIVDISKLRFETLVNGKIPLDSAKFEDNLASLYSRILGYQMHMIYYLHKGSCWHRIRRRLRIYNWDQRLQEVDIYYKRCEDFAKYYEKEAKVNAEETKIIYQEQTLEFHKSDFHNRNEISLKEEKNRLLQDLSIDYTAFKNHPNLERTPGTCEWLLRDSDFHEWRDSSQSCILLVTAGPGCGKSVLARALVDEKLVINQHPSSTICHFFFKDGFENRTKLSNALQAILHQLFRGRYDLMEDALKQYRCHGRKLVDMDHELWDILMHVCSLCGPIICVLDALDECESNEREKLGRFLEKSFQFSKCREERSGCLKFIITSRPYRDIVGPLERLNLSIPLTRIDSDNAEDSVIANEINIVIDARIEHFTPRMTDKEREDLVHYLKFMENRTYLWLHFAFEFIRLHIDLDRRYSGSKLITKIQQEIPSNVFVAYEKLLNRCKDEKETEILLSIILSATRPLSIPEVNVALELGCGSITSLKDLQEMPEDKLNDFSFNDLCGLFLTSQGSKVYLIHHTAREFLLRKGVAAGLTGFKWNGLLRLESCHETMANICMRMLLLPEFRDPKTFQDQPSFSPSQGGLEFLDPLKTSWLSRCMSFIEMNPWVEYFASEWTTHLSLPQDFEFQAETIHSALELCEVWGVRQNFWRTVASRQVQSTRPGGRAVDSWMNKPSLGHITTSNLAIAIEWKLNFLVDRLIAKGSHPNQLLKLYLPRPIFLRQDGPGAVKQERLGLSSVVEELDAMSRPDGVKILPPGLDPLIERDNAKTMASLIRHGLDLDMIFEWYTFEGTLLCYAIDGHRNKIAELLIYSNAVIHSSDTRYTNAVVAAAHASNIKILRILLEKGCDIKAQGYPYVNALTAAIESNCTEAVQALIKAGSPINALAPPVYHGRDAWLARPILGTRTEFEGPLEQGLEVAPELNYFGLDYLRNALFTAIISNSPKTVLSLIESGADLKLTLDGYSTTVAASSKFPTSDNSSPVSASTLGILHRFQVDLSSDIVCGGCKSNALFAAAAHLNYSYTKFLLENGADPTTVFPERVHATPIIAAIATFMHFMYSKRYSDCSYELCTELIGVIRILLSDKVEIDAVGKNNTTALGSTISGAKVIYGHVATTFLKQNEAELYRTLWHLVRILVSWGADPNLVDGESWDWAQTRLAPKWGPGAGIDCRLQKVFDEVEWEKTHYCQWLEEPESKGDISNDIGSGKL